MPALKPIFDSLPERRVSGSAERMRALADQAFYRAGGAPLISGNRVRLLRDATENYPAWLEAIRGARRHVHFENYIVHDDAVGRMFAEALAERARAGLNVRVIYDWFGGLGAASRGFWAALRAHGVEVRCYNSPRLDSPLGWISRDHRKVVAVDGEVGFVTGLCVGRMWTGDPARQIEPWRDTGVEVRGPAVADIERAFAEVWSSLGDPIPAEETGVAAEPAAAGDVSVRIVASAPGTGGTFRLDQLVVAFARQRVWLTDAYYVGASVYVQALITAARDGVDVRILLPGSSDLRLISPITRSGYRPLLEAGVRVFEWNGPMLHAKTAVVDGRWSRVGSTNLNLASWLGNCEMDVVIEDELFSREMEAMYLEDLGRSTEIVLNKKHRIESPAKRPEARGFPKSGGSTSRATAGAVRIGNTIGAAITNRRTIGAPEGRLMLTGALGLTLASVLMVLFPKVFAYPLALLLLWFAIALACRGWTARRKRK